MPWLTILLTAAATATILAGLAQLRIWMADRTSTDRLLFFLAALGVAGTTLLEMRLIRATTPAEFAEVMRWMHLPGALAIIMIAWFVIAYLRAGPVWLAWAFTLARSLVLVVNFAGPEGATFSEVTAVRQVEFLGETVAAAVAVDSPWRFLVTVSMVVLMSLIVVATVSAHRNRTRERPFIFGGVLLSTILMFALISSLAGKGTVPGPLPSIGFVMFLLVAYAEMGRDLARSAENARDLVQARRRMAAAAEAAQITFWELDTATRQLWTYRDATPDGGRGVSIPSALDDFLETVHAEDRERVRAGITDALESGGQIDAVYRVEAPQSGTRWMAIAGSVDQEHGTAARMIRGALKDITQRREAEAELEAQRDTVARAERAMTLGHLSAGLAHELRQPLGAILRDVDTAEILLARTTLEPADLRDVVRDLRAGVDRANEVIARIHDYSTARPASFGQLDMRSVVERTTALVRAEAVRDSAQLAVEVQPDLPPVYGDLVLLQQVLVNLLVNAVEAVRDVAPADRLVSVRVAADGAGRQVVEVSDSGPGIPDEVAGRLFDPFYTTKHDGSGMGLWIARSIVERHGGRLELACRTPGKTTFRFTLDSTEAPAGG